MQITKKLLVFLFSGLLWSVFSCSSDSHGAMAARKSKCDPTADLCSQSSGYKKIKDIQYGASLPSKQILDLYVPDQEKEGMPVLIFLHSGAFIWGDKSDYLATQVCVDFARCGYVTAAVNYRLLTDMPEAEGFFSNTVSLENPVKSQLYEAVRDVRTAVRFLKGHAQEYDIDSGRIFLSGYSAGAITALTAAFMDDTEADGYFTKSVTEGENECLDCQEVAGGQSGDATVAGVISINGAIFDHNILNDEKIPLLLLNSDKDEVIPLVQGHPYQKLLSDKNIKVDLPYIAFQLGITRSTNRDTLEKVNIKGLLPSVVLPKWLPKLSNAALSPNVYGSKAIYDRLGRGCPKYREKYEGGHNFLVDVETGGFNCQYDNVRWRIKEFIEEDISKFHKKSNKRRR